MSYQVLARKWRPRNFHEMVGQEHVLKALVNALDHNRLHHAYLFTGTRGVGKTTIARIFAKCLNCESGISSNPCGTCSACIEITEGRFVDLIEVDAASRTKVEDTRELLDNVQYAPTRGRYKVYLIDEVHMLSGHSFNALLKTLEEPPPHVKFLLATTDPQKLPVTILSRCLQFHLKNMSQERIVGHLGHVLAQESFSFEEPALWQLARAADGSMRDALSLTDQAIAYGNGQVNEAQVSAMLGTIDQTYIHNILHALVSLDGRQVLASVAAMAEQSPDFAGALADIIGVLHRVAIAQTVPEALDNSLGDQEQVMQLAQTIASEDVQLFYQIALHGRRDLGISPDPRAGFEMTLLRMLAFKPQGVTELPSQPLTQPRSESVPEAKSSPPSSAASAAAQASLSTVSSAAKNSARTAPGTSPASSETKPVASITTPKLTPSESMPSVSRAHPDASLPSEAGLSTSARFDEPPPITSEDDYFTGDTSPDFDAIPRHGAVADPVDSPLADGRPTPMESVTVVKARSQPAGVAAGAASSATVAVEPKVPTQASNSPASTSLASTSQAASTGAEAIPLAEFSAANWLDIYPQLKVAGVLQSTVSNCIYTGRDGNQLRFDLDMANATLYSEDHQQRFADQLSDYFTEPVSVVINQTRVSAETPAAQAIRLRQERHAQAVALVQGDPLVRRLVQDFAVEVDPQKIEPTL